VSEPDGYPPGVPAWIEAWERDAGAAAEFYTALFGWERAGDGSFTLRGRAVAGVRARAPIGWTTYVGVDDADETARRVTAAGGTVIDRPSGGETVVFTDPAGGLLAAGEARSHVGAGVINEPSAWSWAHLFTPDPEGAEAFYGAVFGWETEAFGEATMFRLPGYVGGKPEQPVPRDVVAGMEPMPPDHPAGPGAQWRIDFWVDDVDATVARAIELGGGALVPAFDTPINRQAVLADPQGAAFSVSRITIPS